ncbi:hypothetical protein ACFQ08_42580 [Streptosporangium algeriense]|uniref:Uncharacterized protein n=1 Tax=Streptosporangium algeriense TaxID=1682748 RepID=A0ABW3E8B5_9ACTN
MLADVVAVDDVGLRVQAGQIHALPPAARSVVQGRSVKRSICPVLPETMMTSP